MNSIGARNENQSQQARAESLLARQKIKKLVFEKRTFECSTCERTEVASFAVDPMKTDAVGWLAGELNPPR